MNQSLINQNQLSQQEAEEKKKGHIANILCIVSTILVSILPILALYEGCIEFFDINRDIYIIKSIDCFINFIEFFLPFPLISAFILMIIARVIAPKNLFAKILMWVYISLILLACLLFFVTCLTLFLSCAALAQSCPG